LNVTSSHAHAAHAVLSSLVTSTNLNCPPARDVGSRPATEITGPPKLKRQIVGLYNRRMAPISRPCRRCKIALEIECDMEWLWAPLMFLAPAMPLLIVSCFVLHHHLLMAFLVCFCVSFFCWMSMASGIITPWCCNCAYRGLFSFMPARKVWQMSACQKCQDCDSIGKEMRKL
jgi:hypothetical protein